MVATKLKQEIDQPNNQLQTEILLKFYHKMFLIRQFETRLLELFSEGKLSGTTHTCVGQEAVAVSVLHHRNDKDIVFSSHRCHGHYLACNYPLMPLFAEIMGKKTGLCGGRGGSQHLYSDNFYSNGIQGSYLPICVGLAKAEKDKGTDNIVFAFIGDGTWGEGTVYEALNIASLWKVPLLIIVEDNGYAQTTPKSLNTGGILLDRPKAFGISASEISSHDINVLTPRFASLVDQVRKEKECHVEFVKTYRFNAHSKGDDDRNKTEIEYIKRNFDPILKIGEMLNKVDIQDIECKVKASILRAELEATEAPPAEL